MIGRILCFLSGIAVLCFELIPQFVSRRKCTEKVVGKCVGHNYWRRGPKYTPEYEILWHGKPIVVHNKWYVSHPGKPKPEIGTEVMLRVNPNNPLDFCTNKIHLSWGIILGACVFFALVVLDIVLNGI